MVATFLTLAATSILLACGGDDDSPYFDHSGFAVISLTAQQLSAAPAIGRPVLLRLADTLLWVADAASDPGLHVLNARTGALIQSLGKRGEGPAEFSSYPFAMDLDPGRGGALWAFDLRLQRLTRLEPRPHDHYEIRTIQLDGQPRIQRVTWVSANGFIGHSSSDQARFSLFTADGARYRTVPGDLLGPADAPRDMRLGITNNGVKLCPWPDRGFVVVHFMMGRIEYHDADARLVRTADVPFPSQPELETNESGQVQWKLRRGWYYDCTATREHVFALFSGRIRAVYPDDAGASGEFVHVFDWIGTLKAVFRLDRDIRAITVSSSGEHLFGASLVDGGIYRYDLPRIEGGAPETNDARSQRR
jgi:hypothetical protein